jgi:hypothetical protein
MLDPWMKKPLILGHTCEGNGYNTRKVYKHLQGICEASPLSPGSGHQEIFENTSSFFGCSSEIGSTPEISLEGKTKFWMTTPVFFVTVGQKKVSSTCFLNALSVRVAGVTLIFIGI